MAERVLSMRALLIVSASLLLAMAAGNASALCRKNTNFPMIDKGMTLDEVNKLIGKPVSAESGPEDSKVLFYCLASSFLDTDGSDTREYWVQMMGGKVIGYGERNDAASMQRAQRQYAAAWASANMIVNSTNQAADRMTYQGAPVVRTQVNVQQNTVVQPVAPAQEATQPANDQSTPDWRKWKPL